MVSRKSWFLVLALLLWCNAAFLFWSHWVRFRSPSATKSKTATSNLRLPTGMTIFRNRNVLAVSTSSTVYFFDSQTGRLLNKKFVFDEMIRAIATVSQNTLIVGTNSGKLHFVNTENGKKKTIQAHREQITAIAVSNDSRLIATAGRDNLVFVWDRNSLELYRTQSTPMPLPAKKIRFCNDNTTVVYSGYFDTVEVWDLETDSSYGLPVQPFSIVNSFAISKDGRSLYAADSSKNLHSWIFTKENGEKHQLTKIKNVFTCMEVLAETIIFADLKGQLGTVTPRSDLLVLVNEEFIFPSGFRYAITSNNESFYGVTAMGTLYCWNSKLELKWKYEQVEKVIGVR